ncbi:probable polygalacturonase [Phoenix dactylifera]|uniref:Probable polygalacturonase n=1 Tax=Phoenix dactylifera TaxID=42345 RepID=A0A8B8ZYQ7_PHODC|nr:probable polygalacturonase [Phoenix dactylifera]
MALLMSNTARKLYVPRLVILWMVALVGLIGAAECTRLGNHGHHHWRAGGGWPEWAAAAGAAGRRAHTASLKDFGAVGDGTTSNTHAFAAAIAHLSRLAADGGAMLVVPPGKWLTGPFNVTSNFTLFLHRDAEILASQDLNEWRVIDPLPSYGRGRDSAGGRYSNFIMGTNLTDVVITGDNGTINGQGRFWWDKFRNNQLKYTRGYLLEIMYSDRVLISNITFKDSPSWNVHPVYSSNIVVSNVTILAPFDSANTDGIDPDSCSHVLIEDCFIVSGDDCIAIKSGWDEYGIAFNMPTQHVNIRRLTCISPFSATIALGSEMSGGIQDVRAENITAINTESGVRIKTAVGRGGFVKDIFVRGMTLNTMKYVFWMSGNYGQHPDDKYDPNAIPVVRNIRYSNVVAENVTIAGHLEGIPGAPFTGICLSNVTIDVAHSKKKLKWNCTEIEGVASAVTPTPCALLRDQGTGAAPCPFPADSFTY